MGKNFVSSEGIASFWPMDKNPTSDLSLDHVVPKSEDGTELRLETLAHF